MAQHEDCKPELPRSRLSSRPGGVFCPSVTSEHGSTTTTKGSDVHRRLRMPAARNANEQAVLDFFETLSTGNLDALGRLMDEDMSWETMVRDIPGAGLHQGRDKILNEF